MVAIDCQNPDPGEAEIARFVDDLAYSLGYETQRFEVRPKRTNLIVTVDAGPVRRPRHLDTKPVGYALHERRTPPRELTIDGDVGYGLGTSDMKGAIAAMVAASQPWAATAERRRPCLVLTADEEAGSEFGARAPTTRSSTSRRWSSESRAVSSTPGRRCSMSPEARCAPVFPGSRRRSRRCLGNSRSAANQRDRGDSHSRCCHARI
ncbi:MAG: M20/M25/M40 family metallo-hydrolase [Euzebyales bacterium]|nr:M20/M25/M40 family metallo-hydrolase [Euzebyales bacterium]